AASELPEEQVQQHYKSLIKVERCFRQAKSDLNIRPIRHRKARRIRGHIYLNFLGLWLVKQIEKAWRTRNIHCEVPSKIGRASCRERVESSEVGAYANIGTV